jgi:hypothetical protein
MTRLRLPQLPTPNQNDPFERDLIFTLNNIITRIMNQLNTLSDGSISASTTATTAPPTAGTYARGDFVRNSQPTAGGVLGWVCVTGGTPGVWKAVVIAP